MTRITTLIIVLLGFLGSVVAKTEAVKIVLKKASFCYTSRASAVNTFLVSPSPKEIKDRKLTLTFRSMKGEIKYIIRNDSLYFDFSPIAGKLGTTGYTDSITIWVRDSFGVRSKTQFIKVNPLPKVQWRRINPLCWSKNDVPLNPFIIEPKDVNNINISSDKTPGIIAKDTSKKPYQWSFKRPLLSNEILNKQPHTEQLTLTYTDSNGCKASATTNLVVNGNPQVILRDRVYCQDLGSAPLDSSILLPKVSVGLKLEWKVLDGPHFNVLEDRGFPPRTWIKFGTPGQDFYAGNYKLQLCVSNSITGCQTCRDTSVKIIAEPKVEVSQPPVQCKNSDTMDLLDYVVLNGAKPKKGDGVLSIEAVPFGSISRTLIDGHRFVPGWGSGSWKFKYSNSTTGCLEEVSFFLLVKPIPDAVLRPNRIMCENESPLDLRTVLDMSNSKPHTGAQSWSGPNTTGGVFTPTSNKSSAVEGPYRLKLKYTFDGCVETEYYEIRVRTLPEVHILNGKPGQVVGKNAFPLYISSRFDNGVQWKTILGSDGSFKDPNLPYAEYLHGNTDENRRYAWVKVSTTPLPSDEVCPQASDSIEIKFVGDLSTAMLKSNKLVFNKKLEVENGNGIIKTSVYSLDSKLIHSFGANTNNSYNFEPGIYVVHVLKAGDAPSDIIKQLVLLQ